MAQRTRAKDAIRTVHSPQKNVVDFELLLSKVHIQNLTNSPKEVHERCMRGDILN